MKKLIKSSIFLMVLSAIGFFAYKFSLRLKEIKEKYENCISFTGKELKFDGEEIDGGSYAIMFSGVEMDFTGATLINDATLDLYGEFCGISIILPEDWQVVEEGESFRSGFSSQIDTYEIDETKPILYINYNVRYSGLEIKH
ncbi:MAG: hypothetical protein CVU84_02305 [Firmicutes bacterium HGW-Firmicutes-1]|jgi:hypothetical protein|nr:MAG: hypothetical protein CVU84_02305 [Firmicutes bacterium HGW-Firmicutes-1]